MESHRSIIIAGVFLAFSCLHAGAQTYESLTGDKSIEIAWASDAFATNLRSNGTTTFGGSPVEIRFEIGTFAVGFDPRTASPAQWAANWIVLQSATYDKSENQVIQTATLSTNSAPFTENSQAYIWGYTTKDVGSGQAEWIMLAADSWKWPSLDAPTASTFSVSDVKSPSEMILGSVNGTYNGTSYHMMLSSIPVPEPSVPLVSCLTTLGLLLRRKR